FFCHSACSLFFTLSLLDALPILMAIICVEFIEPTLLNAVHLIPSSVGEILLIIMGVVMAVDFVGTITGILSTRSRVKKGVIKERSEEHTSELQSRFDLICRLLSA